MILSLYISAELENVTNLEPKVDHEWHFNISCSSCREEDKNLISFNRQAMYDIIGSKQAKASLVMKCKFCRREGSIDFLDNYPNQPYRHESSPEFEKAVRLKDDKSRYQRLAMFECRGLELVNFDPKGLWKAVGLESGTLFEDIDLSKEDWADYDEKAEEPVSVSDIKVEFIKEKKKKT